MMCLKCLKCLNIVHLIFNIIAYFTHKNDLQNKRDTALKVKKVKAPLQSSYNEVGWFNRPLDIVWSMMIINSNFFLFFFSVNHSLPSIK